MANRRKLEEALERVRQSEQAELDELYSDERFSASMTDEQRDEMAAEMDAGQSQQASSVWEAEPSLTEPQQSGPGSVGETVREILENRFATRQERSERINEALSSDAAQQVDPQDVPGRRQWAQALHEARPKVELSDEVRQYARDFDHDKVVSQTLGVDVGEYFADNPQYQSVSAVTPVDFTRSAHRTPAPEHQRQTAVQQQQQPQAEDATADRSRPLRPKVSPRPARHPDSEQEHEVTDEGPELG